MPNERKWLTDNAFMDFNESPAESVVGWKGLTALGKLDVANTPMSLEVTRVGYNNNWQNYPATGPLSKYFAMPRIRIVPPISLRSNSITIFL